MAASAGLFGFGQLRWSSRFTGQLDILRLMTRGLHRRFLSGSGSARISPIACSCAAVIAWGGKSRLGAGRAAGGAE